jgi:hypothetical protein
MTWGDMLSTVRATSKYGASLTADDPGFRAGMTEVERRRQRGE